MIYISSLAYSFHVGRDKNKKNSVRKSGKSNVSGSTSMSNNAIQNATGLSKADKHNCRKYDDRENDIEIIRGTNSLYNDVKNLYKEEFEEAVLEYNSRQSRDDRKIKDYFTHVSKNSKNDLACEIIIELGDKEFWDTKDMNYKKKMTNVYKQQVVDLEKILPNFKIANAIIHYDETSPHMHIIGVPIKYKNKNGISKQVGKSDVFTKESLRNLQDQMRALCINSFNKEYNSKDMLNEKMEGRNIDYYKQEYIKMKKNIKAHQKNLKYAKDQSDKLKNDTKEVKKILNNAKVKGISKNQIALSLEDKDKVNNFINQVEKTNKDYDKIQNLSVTLKEIDFELLNNNQRIEQLTITNERLNLDIEKLNKKIEDKDEEISELQKENNLLKKIKIKFASIIHFLLDKIIRSKDRDKYIEFANEL